MMYAYSRLRYQVSVYRTIGPLVLFFLGTLVKTTSHNEHGCVEHDVNPLVTNGLSHPYHLDESISIFRGIRDIFLFSI